MTGNTDGAEDAGALRDLLTDNRGHVQPATAAHFDQVLEDWDGRRTTAEEVRHTLAALRRELGLPDEQHLDPERVEGDRDASC